MKFSLVVSTSAETAVGQAPRPAKLAVELPTVVDVFKLETQDRLVRGGATWPLQGKRTEPAVSIPSSPAQ